MVSAPDLGNDSSCFRKTLCQEIVEICLFSLLVGYDLHTTGSRRFCSIRCYVYNCNCCIYGGGIKEKMNQSRFKMDCPEYNFVLVVLQQFSCAMVCQKPFWASENVVRGTSFLDSVMVENMKKKPVPLREECHEGSHCFFFSLQVQ